MATNGLVRTEKGINISDAVLKDSALAVVRKNAEATTVRQV